MKKLFTFMLLLLGVVQSTYAQEPYAVLSEDNTTLTFYYDNNKEAKGGMGVGPFTGSSGYDYESYQYVTRVNSGWDGQRENITTVVFDNSFAGCSSITSTAFWFCNFSKLTEIEGIENLNTSNVTDMQYMFFGCTSLKELDLTSFNTENVIDMSYMFCGDELSSVYNKQSGFTKLNVSSFNTKNVKYMYCMFSRCSKLTSLDVSNFNTANVTDMGFMFWRCLGLTSLNLSNFNTANVKSMTYMFCGCSSLLSLDVSNFDTSNVIRMGCMFSDCSGLSSLDLSSFNTANVTDMSIMFSGCSGLTSLNLSNFNTANVTDMKYMFSRCSKLTSLDLSNFNTAKVTDMSYMFDECRNLIDLDVSKLNTTNVQSMEEMFDNCSKLTSLNLRNFNTAKVTSMRGMFSGCSGLTSLNVSSFNTSNVTDMSGMFGHYMDRYADNDGCSSLTSLDVSNFNTSNVKDMEGMFRRCSSLTSLNLSNFNTAKVTEMDYMFSGCSKLTSVDLSSFNTANVTNMYEMFCDCSELKSLDLSIFDTDNVKNTFHMFDGCSALTTIYSEDAWSCERSGSMFEGCISLKGAISYDSEKTDIAMANPVNGYFTSTGKVILRPYAVLSEDNTKLTFYYDANKKSNGGMSIAPFSESSVLDLQSYQYVTRVNSGWYGQRVNITMVVFDKSFANYTDLSSTAYWFYECSNLATINGKENLNTANVNEMNNMFYGCSGLTSLDVSNLNTANVTNMSNMFSGCPGLTSLDVSNLNTAKVTNMSSMFSGCSGLTSLDVSNLNTANVTNMSNLFKACSGLTNLTLGNLNTSNVTDMEYMFDGCSGLTSLDVSNLNTANVTDMEYMFNGCSKLTSLDLSNFDTKNVRYMYSMFNGCSGLTTIFCNDTWSCPYSTNMFKDCTSLVGAISYDENKTDVTYANPTTGYFTKKTGDDGKVKLSKTEAIIEKGKTLTLKATVTPSDLADKTVTWESSDTKIATVSSAGKVKGVKTGTATITCTSNSTGAKATCEVTVGSVKLDQTEIVVEKAKTVTLKATAYPSSLEDKTVTWESSDTKIATVSSKGKVKGVKTGTATITCTSNATGLSTTCKVTVGSVKLDQTEAFVEKGKTVTLKATAYPSTLEDKTVTWKSSNTAVATVSSKGKVKGVRTGTATITCTSNATGLSTTCEVTVGSVKLDRTEVIVNKGKTVTLKAAVYPSTLEDKTVTWTSSNTAVATVSSKGKVKGVKTGTATITCTSNATGLSATCEVTVGCVKLDQTEVTVKKGETVTLTATVYPSSLENRSVFWESSDWTIATVSREGVVEGLKAGTAIITCTSVVTDLSTTCTVTVTSTSGSRSLDGDDDELTGIEENVVAEEPFDVYDLNGRKVLHQVTSLDGLADGVYIVNGKKIMKKK